MKFATVIPLHHHTGDFTTTHVWAKTGHTKTGAQEVDWIIGIEMYHAYNSSFYHT